MFDIKKAKEAGYSDEEIVNHISTDKSISSQFDFKKAIEYGYQPKEILSHIEKEGINGRPYGLASFVANKPKEALAGAAISNIVGAAEGIEALSRLGQPLGVAGQLFKNEAGLESPLTDKLNELAGVNELSKQDQIEAQVLNFVTGFIPAERLIGLLKGGAGAAKTALGIGKEFKAAKQAGELGLPEQSLKEVGEKVRKATFGPNLEKEVPEILSAEGIKNTTSAGRELKEAVSEEAAILKESKKKAYAKSDALNKKAEIIDTDLISELEADLPELEAIPDPSATVKRYIESTKKMLHSLVERGPNGEIIGYKPISRQTLINQQKQYNLIPKEDFPTDTKTGIFKRLSGKINGALERSAAQFPEAQQALEEAKALHAQESELFSDAEVYNLTSFERGDLSKDFINKLNPDSMAKLKPVLERSEKGRIIFQKMKRAIVEKELKEFIGLGARFEEKEISRRLSEYSEVFTEKEIKEIEKLFQEARTPGARATSLAYKFYKFLKRPSTIIREASKS